MAEKAQDNAEAKAQIEEEEEEEAEEEEISSDRESEEGVDRDGDEPEGGASSPKKKVPPKSPKKKKAKVTSGGMQIPEYWPWEEAKKLFITPDVVKADDMEVSFYTMIEADGRLSGKRPILMV
jgi:flap endonuclease-1